MSNYSTRVLRDEPGHSPSENTVAKLEFSIEDRSASPHHETMQSYVAFLRTAEWLDCDFYGAHYADVLTSDLSPEAHFWEIGFPQDRSPNFYFDPDWYLAMNPGLEAFGKPALYHYAMYGDFEERKPSGTFDPAWYRTEYRLESNQSALLHYLSHRQTGRFSPVSQFDLAFYCHTNPDVVGIDPFQHFVEQHYKEGRDRSSLLNIGAYGRPYLTGCAADIKLLLSYIANRYGSEGGTTPDRDGIGAPSVNQKLLPVIEGGVSQTLPDARNDGPGTLADRNDLRGPGERSMDTALELTESCRTCLDPPVADVGSDVSWALADDAVRPDALAFDEDTYLVAFPEVALAISAGAYASASQHYMEHGKRENRLADDSYRMALRGRKAEGQIDFYGHNSLAGGWIFCGWTSELWNENDPLRIVAYFENGEVAGECFSATYQRRRLDDGGETGLVLFIQGATEPQGPLICVGVCLGGLRMAISANPHVHCMPNQEIASATRSLLGEARGSDNARELLKLLSTSGYGRLTRLPVNGLDGFIDFYGYLRASDSWCLCGWTSRSWNNEVGPESLTLHFADGDIESQNIVAGFYPREDLAGNGVGFILALRAPDRPLGSLVSVALHRRNVISFLRASPEIKRCREFELTERLLPSAAQIEEPSPNRALFALLSRKPYNGSDTLANLSEGVFLEFDEVIACPPAGLVMMGWLLAKPGTLRSMRLRAVDMDEPVDLLAGIQIDRADVITAVGAAHGFDDARCGFIAYVPATVSPGAEMYLEIETSQQQVGYRKLPPPKLDGISAIKKILDSFDLRYADVPRAYDRTVGPAVDLLNRRRLAIRPSVDAIDFGSVNVFPRFSIVIPLYGRLDLIEYQMAFMSDHQPMKDYEFIFVLDDPARRLEALRLFDSVHSRFRIPFRALLLAQNVGFAPASNVGLGAANGTYVCFLNSDVFPGTPDWLERLALRLEQNPEIGTVGPLLLYGDDTVQHEGMTLKSLPEFGNWLFGNHPRKGLRKPALSGLHKHISITGACMLMKHDLARQLGGFDESYIIGDFEDSDLCLRLHLLGLDSAVDLDVELYHLERKSQAPSSRTWRMNMTLYNAWVHQRRWADTIAAHPRRQMTLPAVPPRAEHAA